MANFKIKLNDVTYNATITYNGKAVDDTDQKIKKLATALFSAMIPSSTDLTSVNSILLNAKGLTIGKGKPTPFSTKDLAEGLQYASFKSTQSIWDAIVAEAAQLSPAGGPPEPIDDKNLEIKLDKTAVHKSLFTNDFLPKLSDKFQEKFKNINKQKLIKEMEALHTAAEGNRSEVSEKAKDAYNLFREEYENAMGSEIETEKEALHTNIGGLLSAFKQEYLYQDEEK